MSSQDLMVMVDLEGVGGRQMTTWVDQTHNFEVGSNILLKGDKKWYTVVKIYDLEISREHLDQNRNWDNNNYDKHISQPMKDRLS